MDIRLHIGAHRTATRHLRQMLENNRELLGSQGICVPEAKSAEHAFAQALTLLRKGAVVDDVNAKLLSTLTGDREYRRIVLVDPNISGTVLRPVGKEFFYPRIGNTISKIQNALNGLPLRLFISVRNPATFIPSCYGESLRQGYRETFETYIRETNLQRLRWSDFLHRAQRKGDEIPITAWRYEDYPYLWREVAQAFTGIENREDLVGTTDRVNRGLSLRGAVLMQSYLNENPPKKAGDFDQVQAAFEEKFPSVAHNIYNPTWPEELTLGMTENYEDDWYYIERMDNVETVQLRKYA